MKNIPIAPWKRFCIFCAGADVNLLTEATNTEVNRFVTLGLTVLVPTTLALLSGSYAAWFFTQNTLAAIGIGMVYGLIILIIDRAVASAPGKNGFVLIGRFVMTIMVGLVISFPVKLKLFEDVIDDELYKQGQAATTVVKDKYKSQYKEIDQTVDKRRARTELLLKNWNDEADGTAGTGKHGNGEVATMKHAIYAADSIQLVRFEQQQNAIKDTLRTQERAELTTQSASQAKGLLGRYKALGNVEEREPFIHTVSMLLWCFFCLLEVVPILIKLSGGSKLYEELVNCQNEAKLTGAEKVYPLREEVEAHAQAIPLRNYLNTSKLELAAEEVRLERERAEIYIEALLQLGRTEQISLTDAYKLGLPEEKAKWLAEQIQAICDRTGNKIVTLPELKDSLTDMFT